MDDSTLRLLLRLYLVSLGIGGTAVIVMLVGQLMMVSDRTYRILWTAAATACVPMVLIAVAGMALAIWGIAA